MKKLLSVILALMMLITALAGCAGERGSAMSSAVENSGKESRQDSVEEADGKLYELVMQWPSKGTVPSGLGAVEEAVNEITEGKLGVHVILEPVSFADLNNETALAVSSGTQLDWSVTTSGILKEMIGAESFLELDELLEQYGPDIQRTAVHTLPAGYYDGKLYGIPTAWLYGKRFGFAARQDMLDKYNIQIDDNKIYSLEELGEILETVKEGEGDGYYCVGGNFTGDEVFMNVYPYDPLGSKVAASGVLMLKDNWNSTDIVNLYETKEYETYVNTMYEWNQKGFFIPDASTNTESPSSTVKAGKCFGYFAGQLQVDSGNTSTQCETEMTIIWTVPACSLTYMLGSVMWYMPITSKSPEKAMRLMNEIYGNDDLAALLQYGIEGESYIVVEESERGKAIALPEGQTNDTVPYWQPYGVYGNRFNWPQMAPRTLQYYDDVDAFIATIKDFSPGLGYSFVLPDDLAAQYVSVSGVIQQYQPILDTGSIDPATELPEFIAALKTAGIDDVIERNNKAFKEWLASK